MPPCAPRYMFSLKKTLDNDDTLNLCELCSKETLGQVISVKFYKGMTLIYIRSQKTRDHLSRVKIIN